MTAHTQGPWTAELPRWDDRHADVMAGTTAIASIPPSNERDADARLIAAAPELLDLLSYMTVDLDVCAGSDSLDAGEIQEVCAQLAMDARAAIAKATQP